MNFTDEFVEVVGAAVTSAWPDVKMGGVYEQEHVETIPWKDLEPPYAVLVLNEFEPQDWGAGVDLYEVPLDIYGVFETRGSMNVVRNRLVSLLCAVDLSPISVTGTPALSASSSLPPNAFFIESKNTFCRAGRLSVRCLIAKPFHSNA